MRRSAAAALVLLAAGAPTPPPAAPTLPSRDPGAVIATVAARDAAIQSLRARFSATARTGDGERTVSGVLLVARPDRLRFRLLLPFGLTVFDYLRVADRAWLAMPMGGDDAAFSYASQTLPRTFSRFNGRGFEGCRTSQTDATAVELLCPIAAGDAVDSSRVVRIRLCDGAIEEERFITAGAVTSVARYGDYRTIDDAYLPFHIAIADVGPEKRAVEVTIEHYDVNPPLADGVFAPSPSSQAIPSPLAGEGQDGGRSDEPAADVRTPHPDLPPQGGKESSDASPRPAVA